MKSYFFKIALALILFNLSFSSLRAQEALENKINELSKEIQKLTDKTVKFGISLGYRSLNEESLLDYTEPVISQTDTTLSFNKLQNGGLILSTSILFNPKINSDGISRRMNQEIFLSMAEHYSDKKIIEIPIKERFRLRNMAMFDNFTIEEDKTLEEHQFKPSDQPYFSNGEHVLEAIAYKKLLKSWIDDANTPAAEKIRLEEHLKNIKKTMFVKSLINGFLDRLGITANLNILEFSRAQQELTFNKSIEGGLGISYAVNPNIQLSLTREHIFYRAPRTYLTNLAGGKVNMDGVFVTKSTDLPRDNQDLFSTKILKGRSFKVVVFF
ncbi:hypothetical protein [uncultured Arcticibacterium sp.]|uniref:hypothetical protein n=1 Tax=uncultured Arcticibacterium sp. TaxID=2173042 RepID=UPI0030FCA715